MTAAEKQETIDRFTKTISDILQTPVKILTGREVVQKELLTVDGRAKFIIEQCAEAFKVSIGDICGPSRFRNIMDARFAAIGLMRDHLGLTYHKIADFVNRDHTTILHAIRQYKNLQQYDVAFIEQILKLKNIIHSKFPQDENN